MFAETTNVFPGCFRLSARRVDMLREFHLALAGRGEVNGSNASRDGNGGFREAQMCRSNVDGFKHICTALSVPWRIPRHDLSSPHVPIESPRVARSDPEATGASYSRETKDS